MSAHTYCIDSTIYIQWSLQYFYDYATPCHFMYRASNKQTYKHFRNQILVRANGLQGWRWCWRHLMGFADVYMPFFWTAPNCRSIKWSENRVFWQNFANFQLVQSCSWLIGWPLTLRMATKDSWPEAGETGWDTYPRGVQFTHNTTWSWWAWTSRLFQPSWRWFWTSGQYPPVSSEKKAQSPWTRASAMNKPSVLLISFFESKNIPSMYNYACMSGCFK